MFEDMVSELQEALIALEESEEVRDYLRVQELLRDIEYNANKLITVYVE